jgi:hypothetical protein
MEDAAHEEAADGHQRLYLEAGEVMEDAAHEEAADGCGSLCRHPHQPGQPVLGLPAQVLYHITAAFQLQIFSKKVCE